MSVRRKKRFKLLPKKMKRQKKKLNLKRQLKLMNLKKKRKQKLNNFK